MQTAASEADSTEDEETKKKAMEELAFFLLQERQVKEGDALLKTLKFTHRLAQDVLGYRLLEEIPSSGPLNAEAKR